MVELAKRWKRVCVCVCCGLNWGLGIGFCFAYVVVVRVNFLVSLIYDSCLIVLYCCYSWRVLGECNTMGVLGYAHKNIMLTEGTQTPSLVYRSPLVSTWIRDEHPWFSEYHHFIFALFSATIAEGDAKKARYMREVGHTNSHTEFELPATAIDRQMWTHLNLLSESIIFYNFTLQICTSTIP